jgi:hypothetical protein
MMYVLATQLSYCFWPRNGLGNEDQQQEHTVCVFGPKYYIVWDNNKNTLCVLDTSCVNGFEYISRERDMMYLLLYYPYHYQVITYYYPYQVIIYYYPYQVIIYYYYS